MNDENKFYFKPLAIKNYESTLDELMSVAYKEYNKKRSITNYMLGSTIFVSQYPKFWNPYHQKYSMLQRPYKTCQTNGRAKSVINDSWFKILLFNINIYCGLHFQQILISSKKEGNENKTMEIQSIIQSIKFSEQHIPQSLSLGQTLDFVQNQNEIVSYFHEEDTISCIITPGNHL